MFDSPVMDNSKIHYDAEAFDEGENAYMHENGNSIQFVGSQLESGGEWFAIDVNGDTIDQGFYEDGELTTVILNADNNVIGEFDQQQLIEWMARLLETEEVA